MKKCVYKRKICDDSLIFTSTGQLISERVPYITDVIRSLHKEKNMKAYCTFIWTVTCSFNLFTGKNVDHFLSFPRIYSRKKRITFIGTLFSCVFYNSIFNCVHFFLFYPLL